jgi:hypothetical protein
MTPLIVEKRMVNRIAERGRVLALYFPHHGIGDTIIFEAIVRHWRDRCNASGTTLIACIFEETSLYHVEDYAELPDEIWVVASGSAGDDHVMSPEPIFEAVRRTFPSAGMVWFKPMIAPDCAVPGITTVEPYAELARLSALGIFPAFRILPEIPEETARRMQRLTLDPGKQKIVALHCRTDRWCPQKNPSPESMMKLSVRLRQDYGAVPVLVGGNDAPVLFEKGSFILWPRDDTLQTTAQFLRLSSLFIGGDSGPGHLAAAMGTPVISIQNPIRAGFRWGPFCPPEQRSIVPGRQRWVRLHGGLAFDVAAVCEVAAPWLRD